jgi:fructose-1-phosphate kinase PfkB-like protein
MNLTKSGSLQKAATALAAANGVAHAAFLALFGWRVMFSGPLGKITGVVLAVLAAVGLAADAVGWALVKSGGRTRIGRYGLMGVALSTLLAAVLLFAASWTG